MSAGRRATGSQPALLDRLTDEHPDERKEADDRIASCRRRSCARRCCATCAALFNSTQPLGAAVDGVPACSAESVLNFGLPPLSGQLASRLDVSVLEATIREAIVRFEPRILAEHPERAARRGLERRSTPTT